MRDDARIRLKHDRWTFRCRPKGHVFQLKPSPNAERLVKCPRCHSTDCEVV